MGEAEIIRSTRQSQCAVTVLPAVALGAVQTVRQTVLHDEVAGAKYHILVRHGEFHGLLVVCIGVAALAVAIADGLAVQAEYLGVGGDDYFLVLGPFGHNNVGGPIRRHTVDFLDLGFGGGCIPSDGVETCYLGQFLIAVEHAASHGAVVIRQARREGAARDRSAVVGHCTTEGSARDCSVGVVFHVFLKDAVVYGAFVHHKALEGAAADGAVLDVAVVCHTALEGAVLDVAVVFHFFISGEGTTADGAAVCHVSFKGAFLYGVQVCHTAIESAARDCSSRECYSGDVCHCSRKGAVASDGAAVCHTVREEAARDRPFVVCHVCSKVAAGNCRILFQFNATVHSLLGNPSSIGFGIEVVEIIRSTFQNQCAALVLPAVARGAVRTDRIAARAHDELWEGVCCKGPQGEHGEHHAQCQDQAENAFFHRGRPPLLPKAARSFVSGSIIPEKQPEGKQSCVKRPENCANDDFCPLDRAKNAGCVSLLWPFAAG